MVDTLLHHKVQSKNDITKINQFVLPKPYQKCMVLTCHDEMGHLGMCSTVMERSGYFLHSYGLNNVPQLVTNLFASLLHVSCIALGEKVCPQSG